MAPRDPEPTPVDALFDRLLRGEPVDLDGFFAEHPDLSAEDRRAASALSGSRPSGTGALSAPSALGADLPFDRLGDFRLLERIGAGASGVVFRARQETVGRDVALKVLGPDLGTSGESAARFEREAQAIGSLRHPNIVTVFVAGRDRGVRFLAMEYIAGEGLDALLARRGPLPAQIALEIGSGIADALAAAHAARIVHRDVKPSNILVANDGRAMLLDFGLARNQESDTLTESGDFRGSPRYASPEQVRGQVERIGPRTDVWSLAVTLVEAMRGEAPFLGATREELFHRILHADPVLVGRDGLRWPKDLVAVLAKALEKNPDDRYPGGAEFGADLDAVRTLRPVTARPVSPLKRTARWLARRPAALATIVIVALLGLGTGVATYSEARAATRRFDAAVRDARSEIAKLVHHLATLRDAEAIVATSRDRLPARPPSSEERRVLEVATKEVRNLPLRVEQSFLAITEACRRAEAAKSGSDKVKLALAEAYFARFDHARLREDDEGMALWRALAEGADLDGRFTAAIAGRGTLSITTHPAGAQLHLHRYRNLAEVVPDGEARLIPIPVAGAGMATSPGLLVFRVVDASPGLVAGDLVLEFDGLPLDDTVFLVPSEGARERPRRVSRIGDGSRPNAYDVRRAVTTARGGGEDPLLTIEDAEGQKVTMRASAVDDSRLTVLDAREALERCGGRARILREGRIATVEVTAGARLRPSVAAPYRGDPSAAEVTPLRSRSVDPGSYLALVHLPGHEEVRIPLHVPHGAAVDFEVRLLPDGTTPPGFVRIAAGSFRAGGGADRARRTEVLGEFFLQEREVTFAEYLQFLEDPRTAADIDASPGLVRVPRTRGREEMVPFGVVRKGDRFEVAAAVLAAPVVGVSYEDALAYAAWRTSRDAASLRGRRYRLCRSDEWEKAARGVDGRRWPFGNHFAPEWVKSSAARRDAGLEPPFSFPVDESPYGVYDLAGSVFEWLDPSPTENQSPEFRPARGGSWRQFLPENFDVTKSFFLRPTIATELHGFRLAIDG